MDKSQVYTHIDKGGLYKIILNTSIKVEGIWIPAVVFVGENMGEGDTPESFTRSIKSFKENFRVCPNNAKTRALLLESSAYMKSKC